MSTEPITHLEQVVAGATTPVTHLEKVIAEHGGGGGGGGAVSSVNGKTGAVVLTASDVGAASVETVVEVSGTTPTIAAADNTIYECGELTSLTVSSFPATGWFEIDFDSGVTPAVLTLPNDLDARMPGGFSVEANTHYEINVRKGWPMVGSCPIPSGGGE